MNVEIDFASKIIIKDFQIWMDGGSVTLICANSMNQEFQIEFVQNVAWEILESYNRLPGRIYLNDKLVEQRSELENLIINNLENIDSLSEQLERKILAEKIEYVKSEQYLSDINRVKTYNRN